MAVNTSNYPSNSIQGIPQVGSDMNVFDTHDTPRYALGTRIQRADGNEFVYSHYGIDTGPGILVSPNMDEQGTAPLVGKIIVAADAVSVSGSNIQPGAVGSKFIQITIASVVADDFQGGYLVMTENTGRGYTYRIKGNDATGDVATGDVRLQLYDKIQVAPLAASDCSIIGNRYSNLEPVVEGTDMLIAGVSVADMTTLDKAWGWVCVKGVVGIKVDGTIAVGDQIVPSVALAGNVSIQGAGVTTGTSMKNNPVIGQCVLVATASLEQGSFYINVS